MSRQSSGGSRWSAKSGRVILPAGSYFRPGHTVGYIPDTFAPEIDPVGLIDDEAEFVAMNGFDWSKSNLQQLDGGEPVREGQ